MAPGTRSKFGAPMFELEIFRKQMHCVEESTCDIFGIFRRPGNCVPPRYDYEHDQLMRVKKAAS